MKAYFYLLYFLLLFTPGFLTAQPDSSFRYSQPHLRISLITCGTGDELYASFGHTAVRIVDSNNGTDIVYNYGTFNYFDENFELKFMRGKLLYYLSSETFGDFISLYAMEHRRVEEQTLRLSSEKAQMLQAMLNENLLPEHRAYKYDFYFDNCATRIRDLFPKLMGNSFSFGPTIRAEDHLTYRQITDVYLRNKHWERLGINLLLGSKVDKQMSNEDIMFLPDYLQSGVENATYNGMKFSDKPLVILPETPMTTNKINVPFLLILAIALFTIAGLLIPSWKPFGSLMVHLLLTVTGLLGVVILLMWLGTDHQACKPNFNILWALPTNLLLVFRRNRPSGKYALIAIGGVLTAVIIHILGIQQMPLLELSSLFVALLFIYGKIYRNSKRRNG